MAILSISVGGFGSKPCWDQVDFERDARPATYVGTYVGQFGAMASMVRDLGHKNRR
jgi:hypothetical protein